MNFPNAVVFCKDKENHELWANFCSENKIQWTSGCDFWEADTFPSRPCYIVSKGGLLHDTRSYFENPDSKEYILDGYDIGEDLYMISPEEYISISTKKISAFDSNPLLSLI